MKRVISTFTRHVQNAPAPPKLILNASNPANSSGATVSKGLNLRGVTGQVASAQRINTEAFAATPTGQTFAANSAAQVVATQAAATPMNTASSQSPQTQNMSQGGGNSSDGSSGGGNSGGGNSGGGGGGGGGGGSDDGDDSDGDDDDDSDDMGFDLSTVATAIGNPLNIPAQFAINALGNPSAMVQAARSTLGLNEKPITTAGAVQDANDAAHKAAALGAAQTALANPQNAPAGQMPSGDTPSHFDPNSVFKFVGIGLGAAAVGFLGIKLLGGRIKR